MEHRAEDRGSESVYAKCCMYIGCKWMYVYETVAVEFEGGGCRCLCGTRGLRCILCIIYTSIVSECMCACKGVLM